MVYTCMVKLCGFEFEHNSDLVEHLKEVHQIEVIDFYFFVLNNLNIMQKQNGYHRFKKF